MTVLPGPGPACVPLALAALVAGVPATWAQQAPPVDPLEAAAMSVAPGRDAASRHDDRAPPKGDAQQALKQRALQARLAGKTSGKTHRVAKGQYVELEREGEDSIWTVVGEFGLSVNPTYPGLVGPLTTRFRSPTGPSTTPRSGPRTSRSPTTRTCCSTMIPARSRCATSTSRSRPTATR
jgi:hypothetical protein